MESTKNDPRVSTTDQPAGWHSEPLAQMSLPSTAPSHQSVATYCEIGAAKPCSASYDQPPLPVLAAFAGDALHQYLLVRPCDLQRAADSLGDKLIRSVCTQDPDENTGKHQEVLFRFGAKSFLQADNGGVMGYADIPSEAKMLAVEFARKYEIPAKAHELGRFQLIRRQGGNIMTESVSLEARPPLSNAVLDLHFGAGFSDWHQSFSVRLQESKYGLTIFEGPPGTGKTSYLRHMMSVLDNTHRFYFIPTAAIRVLSDPDFIGFWAYERREYQEKKFVVIIEDAEAALLTRDMDNREQVSAILNLTDGMLADFLRLQIICTINCSSTEIDAALLRPGRLLCHRFFGRLNYTDASRLAIHLGKPLLTPQDYSLAEIYHFDSEHAGRVRALGFAN